MQELRKVMNELAVYGEKKLSLQSVNVFVNLILCPPGEPLKSAQHTEEMVLDSLVATDKEMLGMTFLLDGTKTFFYVPMLPLYLLKLLAIDLSALLLTR